MTAILATLHADMNKYKDPSHAEYMRQANLTEANKQTAVQSPFLISSIQPVTQNGRTKPSNGYATHTNGNAGGMMNINVNPMSAMLDGRQMDSGDVTAECDSDEEERRLQV